MKNGGSFHSYVSLPEGNPDVSYHIPLKPIKSPFSYGFPMVSRCFISPHAHPHLAIKSHRRLLRARVDQLLLDLAGPQVAQQAHCAWSRAEEKGHGILIRKWIISGLYSGL